MTRVDVEPSDSLDDLRRKASMVRPSPRQVAWQRQELTAFVHFGPNTFTDLEWGTGVDDPAVFDPSALDCSQWVRTLVSAGFKSVILTAKHDDGFCLWPSRYLPPTVAASPYRGDVVASLASACQEHGLGLGFYLSPADLYQEKADGGYYGNGSPVVSSEIPSLVVDESLPRFRYDVDDYNRFYLNQLYELLTQYGPIAEVWLDGANPTSTAPAYAYEVNVSIRPGWFYHAAEDSAVKSLPELLDIYRKSVGRNAVLLLNIPPDRRGLFAPPDVARLAEFGAAVREYYETDVSLPATVNVIDLREDISHGQQVESFAVDALLDGEWTQVAAGTTIGHRRLLPLDEPLWVSAVRLRILSSRAEATAALSLHYDPTI